MPECKNQDQAIEWIQGFDGFIQILNGAIKKLYRKDLLDAYEDLEGVKDNIDSIMLWIAQQPEFKDQSEKDLADFMKTGG